MTRTAAPWPGLVYTGATRIGQLRQHQSALPVSQTGPRLCEAYPGAPRIQPICATTVAVQAAGLNDHGSRWSSTFAGVRTGAGGDARVAGQAGRIGRFAGAYRGGYARRVRRKTICPGATTWYDAFLPTAEVQLGATLVNR